MGGIFERHKEINGDEPVIKGPSPTEARLSKLENDVREIKEKENRNPNN